MAKKLNYFNKEEKKEFHKFLEEIFKECTKRSVFIPLLNSVEKEVLQELLLYCFRKSKTRKIDKEELYEVITNLLAKLIDKCISTREDMENNVHLYNMKIRYLGRAIIKRPIREKRIIELDDKQKSFLYGRY